MHNLDNPQRGPGLMMLCNHMASLEHIRGPLPYRRKVSTCMFLVAIYVVLLNARVEFGWDRRDVCVAHDHLA